MTRAIIRISFLVEAFALFIAFETWLTAQELPAKVLQNAKSGTVFLKVLAGGKSSQGSGFFVATNLVATNAHLFGVVDIVNPPPIAIKVVINSSEKGKETEVDGKLAAIDLAVDLAFISISDPKIEGVATVLHLSDSDNLRETQSIVTAGFPFGSRIDSSSVNPGITIGQGTVSSLRRNDRGDIETIQLNANVVPGNSGGPVIDRNGNVVGVVTSTLLATQIGFAIPANSVSQDLDGRILQCETINSKSDGKRLRFGLAIRVCDPQLSIHRVEVIYWTAKAGQKRPVDAATKLPAYGAMGDSPQRSLLLNKDATGQLWRGEVAEFEFDRDQEFWIQPISTDSKGKTNRIAAVNHSAKLLKALSTESISKPTAGSNEIARSLNDLTKDKKPDSSILGVLKRAAMIEPVSSHLPKIPYSLEAGAISKCPVVVAPMERHRFRDIAQVVVSPRGDAVYLIRKNGITVEMLDPTDFTKISKSIPVGAGTCSIWCDHERVVVACRGDKKLVFLDRKLEKVGEVIAPLVDLLPTRIVGRAPDDSIMTIWSKTSNPSDIHMEERDFLYLIQESLDAKLVVNANMGWCAFAFDNNKLWIQRPYAGSPGGTPCLFDFSNQRIQTISEINFLPEGGSHRDFSHTFATHDGKNLVLSYGTDSGQNMTSVITPSLDRIDLHYEGLTFAESTSKGVLVAVRKLTVPVAQNDGSTYIEFLYVQRSQGEVVRRIRTMSKDMHPATLTMSKTFPHLLYVPGHELALIVEDDRINVVRCGPISDDMDRSSSNTQAELKKDPKPKTDDGTLVEILRNRFQGSAPSKVILPSVRPTEEQRPKSELRYDTKGLPYSFASAIPEEFQLPNMKLIQMVVDPKGTAIYAIAEEQSKVFVIDTASFSVVNEISVARNPVSIWCDDTTLLVACELSKIISVVDTESRRVKAVIRDEKDSNKVPYRIFGKAPDGSYLTLWKSLVRPRNETPGMATLRLVGSQLEPFDLLVERIEWCVMPDGPNWIVTQSNFGGGPSGVLQLFHVRLKPELHRLEMPALGKTQFQWHRTYGYSRHSNDGKSLFLPVSAHNDIDENFYHPTRTLVFQSDMSAIRMETQGLILSELEDKDCLVGWRPSKPNQRAKESMDILYMSRESGRVVRQINVDGFSPSFREEISGWKFPEPLFVPGREVLVVTDLKQIDFAKGKFWVIRCATNEGETVLQVNSNYRKESRPPLIVYVGEQVVFTPSFSNLPDGKIVYKFIRGLADTKIDESTGEIKFIPTDTDFGIHDMEIDAIVPGDAKLALTWIMEVKFPDKKK